MSELAKIVDQSDLKFINHLIEVAKIGGLKYKRTDNKIEGFYAALRELTKSSEDVSKDHLIKKCLLSTANKIGIKGIEETRYEEKEFIERIYFRYRAKIRLKLKNMSPKQRKELGKQTENWIKNEEIILSGSGTNLLSDLKNGKESGAALFTSSAFGIATLDETIKSIPMSKIKLSKIFGIATLLTFLIPFGFLLFTFGSLQYFFLAKESRVIVAITINLIQKYLKKQEEEYLEKENQKIENEVGTVEDLSQLMEDLNKYIEYKDKTVEEVKDNLWFKRIQKYMEKKNVHIN
ncbi:MAG: hypothetical protein H8E85_00605 [Candidatus Marinimicrobia bacterium]|nr:hypothetical protein [Candidatus Neomarinimicrobiota bacterium]